MAPRPALFVAFAIAIVAVSIPAPASDIPVVVTTISAEAPLRGHLTGVTPAKALRVTLDGGETVELPAREVVTLSFPDARAATHALRLDLAGGDVVHGLIRDENDEGIVVGGSTVPSVTVPIEFIRSLRFPGAEAGLRDIPPILPDGTRDVVFRRGRDTVDRVAGTVDAIGPRRVVLETALGEVPLRMSEVVAIAFGQPERPEPLPAFHAVVLGADGTRLAGEIVALAGDALTLRTPVSTKPVTIALRHVRTIYFRGGDFVFASDLEPAAVEERAYWPGTVWRHRRDRTTDGRPLTIGGVTYPKGLGVHAYCALRYDLGGRFASFRSWIGIDDEVRRMKAKGAVVFVVNVDGEERYRSPLVRGLEPARRLPAIDLTGAKTLELVVEFGDDSHAGDRADWAMPLLLKPKP